MWMEDTLPFLNILWLVWLDLYGCYGSTRFYINNCFSINLFWIIFWFKFKLFLLKLVQQWLFWVVFIGIVWWDFVKLTPISSALLRLIITLIFMWLELVVSRLYIPTLFFFLLVIYTFNILLLWNICKHKLLLISLLKFLLDFDIISINGS
jgi:hypothetical protein